MSGPAPTASRSLSAAEVLPRAESEKALDSTTSGTSGTVLIEWPRARRREGIEDAARAEAVAKRLWRQLIL